MPRVIRAILVHDGLAYDHPFVDGNGRTAPALFHRVMARDGYWLCEYVSISRILRKARAQYAESLLCTETDDNDATYFIVYQLEVLTRAIADLHVYLHRKLSEMREVDDMVRHNRALRAELMLGNSPCSRMRSRSRPGEYTIASQRRAHDVAYGTARSDLLELANRGLLEQRNRGRQFYFVAPPKLRAGICTRTGSHSCSRNPRPRCAYTE